MSHVTLAQGSRCLARITSCHHVFGCAFDLTSLRLSTWHSSPSLSSSFSFSCPSSSSSMWVGSMRSPMRTSANEELGTLADNNPLTGYEPNIIDNYQISETTEIFIQEASSDSRFTTVHSQARRSRELITLLTKVCCQVSRRLSVMLEQGDLFRMSLDHQFQTSEKIHVATWKIRRFSLIIEQKFRNTNSGADYDRRNIQKLNGVIQSQRREIYRAHQGDEQHRRNQQLIHEQSFEQNRDLREAHEKSLNEMEELKRFQGSTFHTISRRKLIEDRDTILEFTGKIQETTYAVDNPTLPVNECFSHLIQILANAKPSSGNAEPQR